MELRHGYIQNPENIPAGYTGAGWIYFSEDDKSIYLDSGSGPIKYSGTVDLSNYYTKDEVNNEISQIDLSEYIKTNDVLELLKGYSTKEDLPEYNNGVEKIDNTVGIKIDEESEDFVSVSETGLKISGIQKSVENTFNDYLNTQGFTAKVVYLQEFEWENLKSQVESGEAYWDNNVIYMVYSND